MKVIIMGCGPSLKNVEKFGFEKFIKIAKDNGFVLICMKKILRYFEKNKINELPNYYISSDSLSYINTYNIINNFINKFEKMYISIPYKVNKNKIQKEENYEEIEINFNFNKVNDSIRNLKKNKKVTITRHSSTGSAALNLAIKLKPQEIYLIGMDENYFFQDNKKIINSNFVNKNNYFCSDYLNENELVSTAPINRIKSLNYIINKSKIDIYNLSDISNLEGKKNISFKEFINKELICDLDIKNC